MKPVSKFYRSRRFVIIGYDFHSEGGAWRSIYRYFRYVEARNEPVMLIDRRKQGTFRQLLCAVLFSPQLLFNGMGTFCRWEGLLACWWRKDILIYLHDTAYMIQAFAGQHPLKYRLFRHVLRRNRVLCVSKQMENYYRTELGATRTHVVREAVQLPESPDYDPGFKHIVMVGSLDERKGVSLFSQVAALAAARNLPWKFHWVGALASQSLGELSKNVRWWGWQDSPLEFVRRADVFFLSSVDDPLPLACLEAMALGKRSVVYRQTGIAEMIEGVSGCAVFENYSADVAFGVLEKVLSEDVASDRLVRATKDEASVPAFATKLEQVVGL